MGVPSEMKELPKIDARHEQRYEGGAACAPRVRAHLHLGGEREVGSVDALLFEDDAVLGALRVQLPQKELWPI